MVRLVLEIEMKTLFTMIVLFSACSTALADCPVDAIEKALAAPLDGLTRIQRAVTDVQSTEGGVWRIYTHEDGKLGTLVRIDAGESGMNEKRLSVVRPDAYGISATRVDYLRHAFIDNGGPNGTAKRTTEYFYFCDGKLYMPPAEYGTLDNAAYAKAGAEAQKAMLMDKDVADVTKELKR